MYGRISAAPRAQFSPTLIGQACLILFQKASTVCPERILPEASVTVPEIITGIRSSKFVNKFSSAKIAAFALRVSKIVSTKNKSTPPLTRASA